MPTPPPDLAARTRLAALVCFDTVIYAIALALTATFLALVFGIATGGGFLRAKVLLFLAGFLGIAYSTVRLWPTSPEEVGTDAATVSPGGYSIAPTPDETRFQEFVRSLPPARWIRPPPPTKRISPAGKLFWGSVGILVVSYLMETVFGIV